MSSIQMLTPHDFLSKVEATLKSPSLSKSVSIEELIKDIKDVFSPRQHFLPSSFRSPNLSDRAKVQAKVVDLQGERFVLNDDDVAFVIRMSDCLNLNELECLRLLLTADRQYHPPLHREQTKLFSSLWYMERKKLVTALQIILQAIVLPRNLEQDLVASIKKCMQDLLNCGLRRQLMSLIKHCYKQATTVSGRSAVLSCVVDSRHVYEEWVMLAHCLFLSSLVVHPSPADLIDVFDMLKDIAAAFVCIGSASQCQVICGLLFSIINPLLPASTDASSAMSFVFPDVSSRNIFHEIVMTSTGDAFQDGIIACVRLAWAIHLLIIEENSGSKSSPIVYSKPYQKIGSCLDTVFSNNAFQVFIDIYFKNVAPKADEEEDLIHIYNTSLHNLITAFISRQPFQMKVELVVDMARLIPRHSFEEECKDVSSTKKAYERANEQIISLLQFVCEIYKREPQLLSTEAAHDVRVFGIFVWDKVGNYRVYDASLKLLCIMACYEKGALSVFNLVGREDSNLLSWRNFFGFLKEYSKNEDCSLTQFPEDTGLIIAFLNLLMAVLRNGNAVEREQWFPDVEPLFMFLNSGKLLDELEDKVKDVINTFLQYCPKKEATLRSYCKKYNVQAGDDGSQRGKRPRTSSTELVSGDMDQPKPKDPRSTTEPTSESTSKDVDDSGSSTIEAGCGDGPLFTYLFKPTETDHNTDPAAAAAPITKIQKTIVKCK